MGIKKNPYEVGYSADVVTKRYGRCECCGLPFSKQMRGAEPPPRWCDSCRTHHPVEGEDDVRRVTRLEEHEAPIRAYAEKARAAADRMQEAHEDALRKVSAALASRDRWQELLAEVSVLHEQAPNLRRCTCGVSWPCRTRQVLDRSPGMRRAIDSLVYDSGVVR